MAWKQQGVFSEVVPHRHICPLLRKWRETSRQHRLFSPEREFRVAGMLRADMVAFLRRSAAKMAGNFEAAAATTRDLGHEQGARQGAIDRKKEEGGRDAHDADVRVQGVVPELGAKHGARQQERDADVCVQGVCRCVRAVAVFALLKLDAYACVRC